MEQKIIRQGSLKSKWIDHLLITANSFFWHKKDKMLQIYNPTTWETYRKSITSPNPVWYT